MLVLLQIHHKQQATSPGYFLQKLPLKTKARRFHGGMLMKTRFHPAWHFCFFTLDPRKQPLHTTLSILTSVCWMACDAALAVLRLSLASSTFSLISGKSCLSSSISLFSSAAPPSPSAASIAFCSTAAHHNGHRLNTSTARSSETKHKNKLMSHTGGFRWLLWNCCSAGWPVCTHPCSRVL